MAKRDPNKPKKQARPGQTKGYCLPPDSGRIKPGEVRNIWGPKGKPKPMAEDPYETVMTQTTRSVINGVETEISVELAILMIHAQRALAGSTASFNALTRARPGRGQRIEANLLHEKQRMGAVQDEHRKALAARLVRLLEDEAERKFEAGVVKAREGKQSSPDDENDPEREPVA